MNDADTILSTVATKILGGDITEDDALEILENNLRLLTELADVNIKDKYDALTVVYKMTNSIYFEEKKVLNDGRLNDFHERQFHTKRSEKKRLAKAAGKQRWLRKFAETPGPHQPRKRINRKRIS